MDLELVRFPDDRLRMKSEPVLQFGEEVEDLCASMIRMMKERHGVGLAAIQAGVPLRVFVMECEGTPTAGPLALCNPEILEEEGVSDRLEGCLSIPGVAEKVRRSARVRCSWLGPDGSPQEGWFEGIAAVCAQHEIDHLDGKVMFDRLSSLKASRAKEKYAKMREAARRQEASARRTGANA